MDRRQTVVNTLLTTAMCAVGVATAFAAAPVQAIEVQLATDTISPRRHPADCCAANGARGWTID